MIGLVGSLSAGMVPPCRTWAFDHDPVLFGPPALRWKPIFAVVLTLRRLQQSYASNERALAFLVNMGAFLLRGPAR